MDTKALEYILEIARCRSVTRAAEALGISQSALSQILLRVERETGMSLFTRQKRALKLTEAGELYVDAAKNIIDIKNRLSADLKDLSNSRHLRIGVTSHWGMRMMKEILPCFYEKFPDVTIELKQYNYSTLRDEYLSYRVDIAAGTLSSRDSQPENCELLREEEMVLITSRNHPFAKKHADIRKITDAILLRDLDGVSFIRSALGSTARDLEDELFARAGMTMRTFCEVTDYTAFVSLVEANLGFAFVSADEVESNKNLCHWHLIPKMQRKNALYIRPGLEMHESERFLIEQIRGYWLFNKDGEGAK
ncbi:MAG: LysR substrate-binding domain-containing protein [Candidatus Heteroscillospira sp.]